MPPQGQQPVYESGELELDLTRRELRVRGVAVPIAHRAFEIIEVLVQKAGELVTKRDLMGRIWPGSDVDENALHVHISAIRKVLGDDRDMLRTVSGRGYRLLGGWTIRQDTTSTEQVGLARQVSLPVPPVTTNLPAAASKLIGRATTVQHVCNLLSAYRAVTLTGPGGIGKTALALEIARGLLDSFQGDGWLVELVSLSDPALVPSATASAVGLRLGGGEISPESVAQAIAGRQLLLILDNCEHLIDAAARLVETIVRRCPRATVLATSREVLRIEGEYVYRVPPLDVPPEHQVEAGHALGHSAIQLFVSRTSALDANFVASHENLAAIAAICRRLDGIPLAIEFAAARAATLGLSQVAARLDNRFELLTGGRRAALPRHQTLRATLDWSYDLLSEAEQRLLRRLAVFPAGFTLEAATAIMHDLNDATSSVVDSIANLVAKSLVVLDGSTSAGRWRLLETVRAYVLEKLAESGEAQQSTRRFAEFFRDFFLPAVSGLPSHPAIQGLARYLTEIDNVRAALDWAFGPAGDPAVGIVLTAAYAPVWLHLSLVAECRDRAERALAALETDSSLGAPLRMQVQIVLGMAEAQSSVERSTTILGDALMVAEGLGDTPAQLRALWGIWSYHNFLGEHRAALPLAERFLAVARRAGDLPDSLVGDRLVGITLHYLGNQAQARDCLERVLDLYVAPPDQRHTMWFQHDQRVVSRAMLARVLCLQGFIVQAQQNMQASIAEAQAANHALTLRYVLGWGLCPIALMIGDLPTAERAIQMLIDLSARHHLPFFRNIGRSLEGTLAIRRGEFASGVALVRATLEASVGPRKAMNYPDLLGALAEGLAGLGQLAEAFATIDEALTRSDFTAELWCLAELIRIRGELLRRDAGDRAAAAAEDCFRRAIEVARHQGALFWELRAALSLARLNLGRHRPDAARQALAPVYDRFTEGFETPDLCAARALLASLPPNGTGSGRCYDARARTGPD